MDKLKPCPFCGGVPSLYCISCRKANSKSIKLRHYVQCENECVVLPMTNYCNTEQQAIEAWNTRKGEEE